MTQGPNDLTGFQISGGLAELYDGFTVCERGKRHFVLLGLESLFLLKMKVTAAANISATIVTRDHMTDV